MTKKQLVSRLNGCKRRIANERDKLRELIKEYESIADDCAEAEEWTLLDRVEFALRDAGFDYDLAFKCAWLAEYGIDPRTHPSADAPRINIKCEVVDNGIIGTTTLNVVRVDPEDDGSFTAVTDHWPSDAPGVAVDEAMVERAMDAILDYGVLKLETDWETDAAAMRAALTAAFERDENG